MFHAMVLMLVLCPAADVPARPEWWAVDRYVAEVLLERDRGEWVREMLAAPLPEDATSLMIRFNLLVRDGRQAVHRDKHHHSNEVDFTLQAMARHLD